MHVTVYTSASVIFILIFFLFLRERVQVSRGREREGRRGQRIQSRLYSDSREPASGLKLTNYEIMT